MSNSGGRTFWATIDRISNKGNGVVEKDDGTHYIVGPVRREAVGKTVEVRMVGQNEAELVDSDLRKDVYAERTDSTAQALSVGDIVSGRIRKRSVEGIPLLEKDGIRIEVPGVELNEEVQIKFEEISGSNPQWVTATRTPVDQGIASDAGREGLVITDVELYDELPTSSSGTVACPVSDCKYTGEPVSVAGHVSGKRDSQHDWSQLGYAGASAYKRKISTTSQNLQSETSLLHVSDAHLGASLTDTGTYPSDSRCLTGFRCAIDIAIGREVDAVLNTGDLFHNDRRGIPRTVRDAAQNQLIRLAERDIPFYSIDGDHERDAGRKAFKQLERDGLVTQINETPQLVGHGLALYGRDFTPATEWGSTKWAPTPPPSDRFGIVAIHQSVKPISNSDWPECSVDDVLTMVGSHAHVIAAGHLHRTGIDWNERLPFVLGGTTEPQRAHQASIKPVVGLFTQDGNSLRYRRIQLML